MRKVHLANAEGRDTVVAFTTVAAPPPPPLGKDGARVAFRRYLAANAEGLHDALSTRLGEDYAKALVDGDPEVDLENVGRTIGDTSSVLLSHDGHVLYAAPRLVEILFGPDGAERERRAPVDTEPNVADELPIRWTKMRFKRADLVHRFVVVRTLQVRHVDGLTYDYLHAIAKGLDDADEVVLLGGGEKGRDPLIFDVNGTPFRAFLEGRVEGPRYQLLLHLSNLELKRPVPQGGNQP